MRCNACGQPNASEARFCARCGATLAHGEGLRRGQLTNNGQYRVLRRLGGGGMGSIYLAQNTLAFDRLCVIKEMSAYFEVGEEAEARARFEQEARTLAALKHPGIPDIYGYYSEGGGYYIVIEYIEGDNLELGLTHDDAGEKAPGRPVEMAAAVRYAVEICRVLEYLAQVKPEPVIHCDIKPSNIIIDQNSQQAVLVDFGASVGIRQPSAAGTADGVGSAPALDMYGTVGYAAPELYQGRASPASDVFSLAATLYHLLTDDDPREHPMKWARMEQVPEGLREVLRRALSVEPAQRPTAEALRRELEAFRVTVTPKAQTLAFPAGNLASTLTGVLDLSLRYWDHARELLYGGTLNEWLRSGLGDTAAADLAQRVVAGHPDAPDAGLDAFLRSLSPRLGTPRLSVTPLSLDLGAVPADSVPTTEVTLSNAGPGAALGTIAADSPWLEVTPERFVIAPGARCMVACRPTVRSLRAGPEHAATITITPQLGAPLQVRLALRVVGQVRPSGRSPADVTAQPLPSARVALPHPVSSAPALARSARRARQPAKRPRAWLWALLVALILVSAGAGLALVSLRPSGGGSGGLQRGLEAMARGDWAQAGRSLALVDPADAAQVEQVGQALDAAMISLDGGTMRLGDDSGPLDQRPAQDVAVRPFAIDRFEVTNVQYQRCVAASACAAPRHWFLGRYPRGEALHPVVNVAWEDARAYADWAGKSLPSEAQWEWAARGAAGRTYPWGEEAGGSLSNTGPASRGRLAPVGSYPRDRTPEGVYDLGGNAAEWTTDFYGPYRVPHSPPAQGTQVALRGGSWKTYGEVAATRAWKPRGATSDDLGFRCIK